MHIIFKELVNIRYFTTETEIYLFRGAEFKCLMLDVDRISLEAHLAYPTRRAYVSSCGS